MSFMRKAPSREDVVDFFNRHGYAENSMITQPTLMSLLKSQYKLMKHEEINSEIVEQIWNQSQASSRGQIYISSICDIVMQAIDILMSRIVLLEGEDRESGQINDTQIEIDMKKRQLQEFKEYLSDNRTRINELNKELIRLQIKERDQIFDLNSFRKDYHYLCDLFQKPDTYYNHYTKYHTVFQKQQSVNEKKSTFLLIFNLTLLILIFQLLAANARLSFLSLLLYLHSFYIVLIHFYHRSAPLYLIIHCVGSLLFDVVYLIFDFGESEFLMPIRPHNRHFYETVLDISLICTIVGRVILVMLYFSVKNIEFEKNGVIVNYYYMLLGNHIPIMSPNQKPSTI